MRRECRRCDDERGRIGRRDAKQESRHQSGACGGAAEPDGDPDGGEQHSVAHDHPHTSDRPAPNAIRTPISRVRWLTVYDITP